MHSLDGSFREALLNLLPVEQSIINIVSFSDSRREDGQALLILNLKLWNFTSIIVAAPDTIRSTLLNHMLLQHHCNPLTRLLVISRIAIPNRVYHLATVVAIAIAKLALQDDLIVRIHDDLTATSSHSNSTRLVVVNVVEKALKQILSVFGEETGVNDAFFRHVVPFFSSWLMRS